MLPSRYTKSMLKLQLGLLSTLSVAIFLMPAAFADEEQAPLQGQVEETGIAPTGAKTQPLSEPIPEPVVPSSGLKAGTAKEGEEDVLKGSAQHDDLSGGADQGSLQRQQPKGDQQQPLLKGFASTQTGGISDVDPDQGDRELEIQWDAWRNKFLRHVLSSVSQKINDRDSDYYVPPRRDPQTGGFLPPYPLGTGATFTVQVTRDGGIKSLGIIRSSGFESYDKCVMQAIKELESESWLQYPRGSRRVLIEQLGTIKTSVQGGYTEQKFGDVERFKEPDW